jgi:hypothetical protein
MWKISRMVVIGAFTVLNFVPRVYCQTQSQSQATTVQPGYYRVEISGGLQLNFEGESSLIRSARGDWSISMPYQEKPDTAPRAVVLLLPGGIKAGIHEIKPYEHAVEQNGRVGWVAATVTSNEIIGLHTSGRLNLTEIGSHYSGTFEFTTESFDKKVNVIVKGSFYQLVEQKKEPEKKKDS